MRRVCLAVGFVLLFLPWSALCAPDLVWAGQDARLADVRVTEEGAIWLLVVRDRCSTQVRKQEVTVVCSDWRPMTAEDPEREVSFKGDVTLPDGKDVRVGRRSGRAAGLAHAVKAQLKSEDRAGHAGEHRLDYLTDPPGSWSLGADGIGETLFLRGGAAESPTLKVVVSYPGGVATWDDGTSVLEHRLDAESLQRYSEAWRCAHIATWNRPDGVRVREAAFDDLMAELRALESACPDHAASAVNLGCGVQGDIVARDLTAAADIDAALDTLDIVRAFVESCPAPHHEPISGAVDAVLTPFLEAGDLDTAMELITAFEPVMPVRWPIQARKAFAGALSKSVGEQIRQDSLEGLTDLVGEYEGFLGEDHFGEVRAHGVSLLQSVLEEALATEDLVEIDAFVGRVREFMGSDWEGYALARRTETANAVACRMGDFSLGDPMPTEKYHRAQVFGIAGLIRVSPDSESRIKALTLDRDCCDERHWGSCQPGGAWYQDASAAISGLMGTEPTVDGNASRWGGEMCRWSAELSFSDGCDRLLVSVRSSPSATQTDDGFAEFFAGVQQALRSGDRGALFAAFQVPFQSTVGISFTSREEFDHVFDDLLPPAARAELAGLDRRFEGNSVEYQLPFACAAGQVCGAYVVKRTDGRWLFVDLVKFA